MLGPGNKFLPALLITFPQPVYIKHTGNKNPLFLNKHIQNIKSPNR